MRLNKFLASCGVAARRKADTLVFEGHVTVNGEVVTEPGRQVEVSDVVCLDGKPVALSRLVYLVMNKPVGVLSAVEDSRERTVIDILPEEYDDLRLFPVGRLDKESQGLIILTNDGEFANEISHPSKGIIKTYDVELWRPLTEEKLEEWRNGVTFEGTFMKPVSVEKIENKRPRGSHVEVKLAEGLKREIRFMARAIDYHVKNLTRRKIGNLSLGNLGSGEIKEYSREELEKLIKEHKDERI